MSDYLADAQPIDAAEFTRRACDPRASAVVEACAGSGKTWLLVGRIIRLLLAGAEPGEILAITFTRRAAQEMRQRLLDDLQALAQADDAAAAAFLRERGMGPQEARDACGKARTLYEKLLTTHTPPTIETFHGWFWQLVARAPIGAGVPFAPALLDVTDRVRADAWLQFGAQLVRPQHAAERAAWEQLVDDVGEISARGLMSQLLAKRAEWWAWSESAGGDAAAVQRALEPLRAAGLEDPRGRVRLAALIADVQSLLGVWRAVAKPGKTISDAIGKAVVWLGTVLAPPLDFRAACGLVLTQKGTPLQTLLPEAIGKKVPCAAEDYAEAHARVIDGLARIEADLRTWRALRLNEAALTCGPLLIRSYQRLKEQQQGLDFADLEWHAHRLLSHPDHAAYMQARLDAHYRHILLDEFQDTNALQWNVLQSWLAAYDETEGRPTVFVVGDPKQSIYRFRRAEPRVFDAAIDLLRRDYGAPHLRTNVTRRNAQAIVDVLNIAMSGNPLYQVQSTRQTTLGAFVLLEPTRAERTEAGVEQGALRDVLTTPRSEPDDAARYREGRVVASEIAHWVDALAAGDAASGGETRHPRWSDVLLLVRRRTHLAEYERALRDVGVPFVSDRAGGLLDTLEADDMTALLGFLCAPFDDLSLAHALRSPVFGCSDDDLIRIAMAGEGPWWQRLQRLEPEDGGVLARARDLLAQWLALAGVLPVHDLLDRIYFEADVRSRYARIAPAPLHAQVQANLDSFIELALVLDSGRYPSLPRFVDELKNLRRQASDDAPDEGAADAGDAVRVMTIHGAKGLQADIVAIADAHIRASTEEDGALVVWPPGAAAPAHFSLIARGTAGRDPARAAWFEDDARQRAQEDWNLLYVAATRARRVLIVSCTAPANGEPQGGWYAQLATAGHLSAGAAPLRRPVESSGARLVRDFRPQPLPTGARLPQVEDSEAQRLGRAWHALLEEEALSLTAVASVHDLTGEQAALAAAAAARVREHLPQFFGSQSAAEVELVDAQGNLLRVDRLIETGEALWIVDFKWRVTWAERAQYESQVQRYAQVLREIRSDKPVRYALITSEAEFIEVAGG